MKPQQGNLIKGKISGILHLVVSIENRNGFPVIYNLMRLDKCIMFEWKGYSCNVEDFFEIIS